MNEHDPKRRSLGRCKVGLDPVQLVLGKIPRLRPREMQHREVHVPVIEAKIELRTIRMYPLDEVLEEI